MSLRTIYLSELNSLAKNKEATLSEFREKVRAITVDRNPATLDPDEHDPVQTVALAWKEVASRGRARFSDFAEDVVREVETARQSGDPDKVDWKLAETVYRLLRSVPVDVVGKSSPIIRVIDGLIVGRTDFLEWATPHFPQARNLWLEAFRAHLHLHPQKDGWLAEIWRACLNDTGWPLEEGCLVILQDAARSMPPFITVERLIEYWKAATQLGIANTNIKREFYLIGCTLDSTEAGREQIESCFDDLGGSIQDCFLVHNDNNWPAFLDALSGLFRDAARRENVVAWKPSGQSLAANPYVEDLRTRQRQIPAPYRDESMTASLLEKAFA